MATVQSPTSSPKSSPLPSPREFNASADPQNNYKDWVAQKCTLEILGVEKSMEMLKWATGEDAQLGADGEGTAYALKDVISWATLDLGEPPQSGDDMWSEVRTLVTSMSTNTQSKKIGKGGGANGASLSPKSVQIEDSRSPSSSSSESEKNKNKETPPPPSKSSKPTPPPSPTTSSKSSNVSGTEGEKESEGVKLVLSFMEKDTTAETLKNEMAQVKRGKDIDWSRIATKYYAPAMALEDAHPEQKTVLEALKLLAETKEINDMNYFFMSLNYFAREQIKGCPNVEEGYCESCAKKVFKVGESVDQEAFTACLEAIKDLSTLERAVYFLPESNCKAKMGIAIQTRKEQFAAPKSPPKKGSSTSSSSSASKPPSFDGFMADKQTAEDVQSALGSNCGSAKALYREAYMLADDHPKREIFIQGLRADMEAAGYGSTEGMLAGWVSDLKRPEQQEPPKLKEKGETKKGGGAPEASSWMPSWFTMFLGAIAVGALAYWQKDTIVNWSQGRKVNEL